MKTMTVDRDPQVEEPDDAEDRYWAALIRVEKERDRARRICAWVMFGTFVFAITCAAITDWLTQ